MSKPNILILGGGYGGLSVATRLQKLLSSEEATITLVNNNEYHYETTWLHEVAAGIYSKERIQYSIPEVLNSNKVTFIQDTVKQINANEKTVVLSDTELSYDYLVVALGFESETFGIKGLKEYALSITNPNSAYKIKERIENQFKVFNTNSKENLTIVIGGSGFTGMEFLGALTDRIPELCKLYKVPQEKIQIFCIEAAPTLLPGFDTKLVEHAIKHLEPKGVTFKVGTAIKECTSDGIIVSKDEILETIDADVVVWAAGVRGSAVVDESNFDSNRGKGKIDFTLRSSNYDNVFIVGDCSFLINKENERPYPPTAQIAIQQGYLCARNITLLVRGNDNLDEFFFDNKGTVCSIGDKNAIGVAFGKKIKGFPASILKKMVDNRALYLIGGIPLVLKKGKFNLL